MISSHHEIEKWINDASLGEEFFMHVGGRTSGNIKLGFQELANRDANFAHCYELLKRAADSRLVILTFTRGVLLVTRIGELEAVPEESTNGNHPNMVSS